MKISHHVEDPELTWHTLAPAARRYVAFVTAAGVSALVASFPLTYARPALFASLLAFACLAATWKVNLPIPLGSSATLSVSYVPKLMALLLLGPGHAVIVAVAAAWTQCTVHAKRRYPLYRTMFSASAEALTMAATGLAYGYLGGVSGIGQSFAAGAIAGAIATYFVVNTGLVAGAIALSTYRGVWRVWRDDFLWSGLSFMTAGAAGAAAAIVIGRGEPWKAALMIVPVYVTYRTYQFFVGRLAAEKTLTSGVVALLSDRMADAQKQQRDAIGLLMETQVVEQELAGEKARLAKAVADMEQTQQLHDQFLATVSHELRNPLTAILGWADILRIGGLAPSQRERAAHAIYTSAQQQAQLVNELLDVARITSGKLALERSAVDLAELVRSIADALQPTADAKRIDVVVDDDGAPGVVFGDRTRLQQVVSNLLSNAIKFTPEGGTVHVSLRRDDDVAELVVADTGPGIPADFLPFVFEPFRQEGGSSRPHGGLGLGLSIVRHLVEAHHGTVKAESRGEGQGAAFTVRLPAAGFHGEQHETTMAADRWNRD